MDNGNDKRQRTHQVNIFDIDDNLLSDISTYLAKEHRVLFAAAMLPTKHWKKVLKADRSTASITSSIMSAHDDNWRVQWETLDLLDIQNSTTKKRKMNDDSLKSILICIDAVNNLKSLKLDTIIGYGLKPLRGSIVIERIDLSMATDHSKPPLGSQSTMSLSAILPILYSIVNKEENSLRHIQLPLKWRSEKSRDLTDFMNTYSLSLLNASPPLTCSNMIHGTTTTNEWEPCGKDCEGVRLKRTKRYGIQTSTCYKCNAFVCDEPSCKDTIDYCPTCQKYYCENCVNVWNCKLCEKVSCAKCEEVDSICQNCHTPFCEEKAKYCIECGTSCCVECDENAGYCQVCDCKICYGCGFESFQCAHCPEMHKICVSCLTYNEKLSLKDVHS